MAKGRKTGGRVHGYPKHEEAVEMILSNLARGISVKRTCAMPDYKGPPPQTFHEWVEDDYEGLLGRYERAKALQLRYWSDEIMDIADDGSNDWEERETKNGGTYIALNREAIERSKLRIGQRNYERERWAAKQAAKSSANLGAVAIEAALAALAALEASKSALAQHEFSRSP